MDHLTKPRDPAFPTPVIRFLGLKYWGTTRTFLTYPRICGIDERSFYESGTVSPERLAPFLQSWLFFGLLKVVFDDSGDDFIQTDASNNKLITTSKLRNLRDARVQTLFRLKNDKPDEFVTMVKWCKKCIDEADFILSCIGKQLPVIQKLTREAYVSMYMFLSYATRAISYVNNYKLVRVEDLKLGDPVDQFFTERMRTRGWCPSLIKFLIEVGDLDGLYYVSNMKLIVTNEHDSCTGDNCVNNQIDKSKYTPLHAIAQCEDPQLCSFWDAPKDDLLSILKAHDNSIPLIYYEQVSGRRPQIRLVRSNQKTPYVAISHVWSHGRGNPTSNSLPQCQLSYISEKVNALYPDRVDNSPIPFWIDTICCPIKPAESHKMALERMATTYENADKVLVLDSTIEPLLHPTIDMYSGAQDVNRDCLDDCLVRLVTTPWMRRLWTLQEALLAKQLYFQFSDGALNFKEARWEYFNFNYNCDARYDGISKGELPGKYVSFIIWKKTALFQYILLLSQNLCAVRDPKRPALQDIAFPLRYRSTSVAEDEAICLSNLLRMDTSRVLSVPAEERMMQIWTISDERKDLTQSVLFRRGPRLDIDGFRWAPTSILGTGGIILTKEAPGAKLTKNGLLLECPGFLVQYHGFHSLDTFTFRNFRKDRYRCTRYSENENGDGSDRSKKLRGDWEASIRPGDFFAILIDTQNLDYPESGIEDNFYPKRDICTSKFDESIFDEFFTISGVIVVFKQIASNVYHVQLDSHVFLYKNKELSATKAAESAEAPFRNHFQSWLSGKHDEDIDKDHLQTIQGLQMELENNLIDMCGCWCERATWCCD